MTSEITRGRGQLRDRGPAGGVYDVDYTIHTGTKDSKHAGFKPTTHKVFSADIRMVGGLSLKNGDYALEKDGEVIYELRKAGTIWHLNTDIQHKSSGD